MDALARSVARGGAFDGNEARFRTFPPLRDSSEKARSCASLPQSAPPCATDRACPSAHFLHSPNLWPSVAVGFAPRGRTVSERVPFHAALHKTFEFAAEGTMKIKERLPRSS